MKKLSIVIMSLILVFAMASCGGNNSSGNGDAAGDMISVVIDIDFPDESGIADVDDMRIEVADGSTVLDVLNAYAENNDGEIIMDETSDTPYVTSINGAAATAAAGWVYEVNDEMVMDSADKYVVKNGDKIDWSFETWDDMDD